MGLQTFLCDFSQYVFLNTLIIVCASSGTTCYFFGIAMDIVGTIKQKTCSIRCLCQDKVCDDVLIHTVIVLV